MIHAPQIFADGIPASGEITYSEHTLSIRAEGVAARVIELVWPFSLPQNAKLLGDAWERGYGELGGAVCRRRAKCRGTSSRMQTAKRQPSASKRSRMRCAGGQQTANP